MHPCAVLPACSYMAEHVTGQCLSVARVRLGLVAIIKQGDLASVRARRRKPAACHDVPCRPSLIMQPKLRVQWLCRASSCTKKNSLNHFAVVCTYIWCVALDPLFSLNRQVSSQRSSRKANQAHAPPSCQMRALRPHCRRQLMEWAFDRLKPSQGVANNLHGCSQNCSTGFVSSTRRVCTEKRQ